jgi:hypothetical protein
VDEANERSDDRLPWVRDNDPMPGRAASTYVRIPVEIAKSPPPPAEEPGTAVAGPPLDAPTTVPGPSATGRRRSVREPAQPASDEFRGLEPGSWAAPGLPPVVALPILLALLVAFLASVALATAVAMVLLPVSARSATAVVAAMLLGLLAYPAGRWALALSGLHSLRLESLESLIPIRSATLTALERRAELRSLASERGPGGDLVRARDALGRYLASHPIGDAGDGRAWSRLGISAETLGGLRRRREELLSPRRRAADEGGRPVDWLRSFQEGFLDPLEEAAWRRVEEHAWRAFKAAAASPNAGVDALVTLSSGSSLIEDLGRLYGVRTGRIGGAVLLVRLLADTDLAGRADRPDARVEIVEPVAGGDGAIVEGPLGGGFRAALERSPVPPVAAEIAALLDRGAYAYGLRAESGLLHYFLMRGLSARAIGLLRPVDRRWRTGEESGQPEETH